MKAFALPLVFAATFISVSASAVSLSDLTERYDVLAKEDAVLGGVRIHGSIAAGDDIVIESSTAEFNLDGNHAAPYSVVAGDAIELKGNGRVLPNGGLGGVRVGGLLPGQSIDVNANQIFLNSADGSLDLSNTNQTAAEILSPSGIDFGAAFDGLAALSDSLKGLASTMSVSGPGDLEFDFSGAAGLQVINLTAAQLGAFGQTKQLGSLASGVRFLVNVDLTGFSGVLGSGLNQNVVDSFAGGILWNLHGSGVTEVEIQSRWVGSILAPRMDLVDVFSNDIRGSVVANSFAKSSGQVHPGSFDYDFDIPKVPDAGATLVLALLALPALLLGRRRFH